MIRQKSIIEKYISVVKRKLCLPRKLKERVMSDFISSIRAMQETGKTEAEILSELGTPQEVAAQLNEQMKEYTYRRSPWRFLFAACGVYGAVKMLRGVWVNLIYLTFRAKTYSTVGASASIGIIGGADGPTAIFVTAPVWMSYIMPAILLIVGVLGFLKLSRIKKK